MIEKYGAEIIGGIFIIIGVIITNYFTQKRFLKKHANDEKLMLRNAGLGALKDIEGLKVDIKDHKDRMKDMQNGKSGLITWSRYSEGLRRVYGKLETYEAKANEYFMEIKENIATIVGSVQTIEAKFDQHLNNHD